MERGIFNRPPEGSVEETALAQEFIEKMTAGEEVWSQAQDSDSGRTAYLFVDRRCVGYVTQEYDTGIIDVVLYPDEPDGEPTTIYSSSRGDERDAAEILRQATGLKLSTKTGGSIMVGKVVSPESKDWVDGKIDSDVYFNNLMSQARKNAAKNIAKVLRERD